MSIYTRTGDTGLTSLFGGKRVPKCEELVDVYGSIDELNSWIGLIASAPQSVNVSRDFLIHIQNDLFVIGSTLQGPALKGPQGRALEDRVVEMEKRIDEMEKELPELKNFILPGESALGAQVHIARAICRRVERQTVALFQGPALKGPKDRALNIIKYLNRLSDLLFILARFINKQSNVSEVVWSGRKEK